VTLDIVSSSKTIKVVTGKEWRNSNDKRKLWGINGPTQWV